MDDTVLDGNAAAGVLQELFVAESTTVMGTCDACGAAEALGAARMYQGAGMVLRCPHCDAVLVKVVRGEGRAWIAFPGIRTLEVPV